MMASTRKVLGQSAPNATTETTLYTVPSATQTVVSTIMVCNRGNTDTYFRISITVGGGTTGTKDFLYYDLPLVANDTFALTLGITLYATDVVRVYAGNANLSFSAFGQEDT